MEKADTLWYFAYGSNMSSAKFTGRRGIIPIKSAKVTLPNWVLVAEIPGVPYSEPSFFSIRRRGESEGEDARTPDVIGVAYLITKEQYREVIASEGGQIAYEDIAVEGMFLDTVDIGMAARVVVRTLGSTSMVRHPAPKPSLRYKSLVVEGAREGRLPASYQDFLATSPHFIPPTGPWAKIGAFLFLAWCTPIWKILDIITHANTGEDGNVPTYIVSLVRGAIFFVWMVHDLLFAPIFGRGDGIGQEENSSVASRSSKELLPFSEKPRALHGTL